MSHTGGRGDGSADGKTPAGPLVLPCCAPTSCPAVRPRPAHLPPARSPPSSLPCSYCSINPPAPHCLCSLMASVLALASPSLTVALLIYTHTPLLLCAHAAAPVLSQLHLEEGPAVPGASEPDCACLATHTSLIECFSRTRGG